MLLKGNDRVKPATNGFDALKRYTIADKES